MAASEAYGFRTIVIACAITVAIGVALLLVGLRAPAFNVPYEQAMAAYQGWCVEQTGVNDAAGDRYLAMFGWRYPFLNAGLSAVLAGLTAGALAFALRVTHRPEDPHWLRTPRHRVTFVAIGASTTILCMPLMVNGLATDLERFRFPSCADSIGIPIMGLTMLTIFFVPILAAIGGAATLALGALPVPLHHWDRSQSVRSWIVTVGFGTLMVGGTIIQLASITTSDMLSPCTVIALYLLGSTRAALLASHEAAPAGM